MENIDSDRDVYFNRMLDRLLDSVRGAATDAQRKAVLVAAQRCYEYMMETLTDEGSKHVFPAKLSDWNRAWADLLFNDRTIRMCRPRASQVDTLFTLHVVVEHSMDSRQ